MSDFIRADEIYIFKLISLYNLEYPKELDFFAINRFFYKCGGSWEKVFHGSCSDIKLLKRCIKQYYKMKNNLDRNKLESLREVWKEK